MSLFTNPGNRNRLKTVLLLLCTVLLVVSLFFLHSSASQVEAALKTTDGDLIHALADLSGHTELLLSQEEWDMGLISNNLRNAYLAIQALQTRQTLSTLDTNLLNDLCVAYRILYSRLSDAESADSPKLQESKPLLESLQRYLKPLVESCVGQKPAKQFPQAVEIFNQVIRDEEHQEFETLRMTVNQM